MLSEMNPKPQTPNLKPGIVTDQDSGTRGVVTVSGIKRPYRLLRKSPGFNPTDTPPRQKEKIQGYLAHKR